MSNRAALVHIVDDDAAVRESMRWLLEGDGLAARTYPSAEAFLATFTREPPGCAVFDVRMPGMSGLELQEMLARRHVRLPIVIVTAHGDIPLAVMAMRRGAMDFIEKPFTDERLITAVRRALSAQSPSADHEDAGILRARAAALSPRERDVLAAVVAGQSSKVIASQLRIAIKTVEAHRARIMRKLGTASLAELVRSVVQHGLLDLPPPP